ncbi:putative adhesin [Lentzea sp. CA-135723]|uniref:putative adhesin n=1 Tax=Lentzea sp. CA-135723 TaxID=3239950 RepID=UPI003D93C463
MVGVLIGHGSFVGAESVVVPKGLTLHFYADEGTSLAMVNVLELIKEKHDRIPMQVVIAGMSVPNYQYEPLKEHERRAITALYGYAAPAIVVGSRETPDVLRLCSNVPGCPKDGPHTCDGVFGRAEKARWKYLLVFSCRVDTTRNLPPTLDLMARHDKRDRSVHQALVDWAQAFVGQGAAKQDETWKALPANERLRLVASDEELREWDDCRAVRETIKAAADPVKAAAVASDLTKLRLMRDYPEHRAAVRATLRPDPSDAKRIAEFLPRSFDDKVDVWEDLTVREKARWMADPGVTYWAAGFNACDLFRYGLRGDPLLGLLRGLEPQALAVALSEARLSHHLADNSLRV